MAHSTSSLILTIPAASRRLGISHKAIRAAIERGELGAVRLTPTGWPRIPEEELEKWLTARRMCRSGN